MLISDAVQSLPDAGYQAALTKFVRRHAASNGGLGLVEAFHAVRNIPYFSGLDRTPHTALRSGRGACTAKHLVLRDILRQLGFEADVELVDCDFSAAVPVESAMPELLRNAVEAGSIRDMHCWVRLRDATGDRLLDATWPDTLAAYGFQVNSDWDGIGNTRPAVSDGIVRGAAEDVLARKEELLAELTEDEKQARSMFLKRLSAWLEDLQTGIGEDEYEREQSICRS